MAFDSSYLVVYRDIANYLARMFVHQPSFFFKDD